MLKSANPMFILNHDFILVVPDEVQSETETGIIIPDSAQEKSCTGTVVSVGKGFYNETANQFKPLFSKVGDRVMWPRTHAKEWFGKCFDRGEPIVYMLHDNDVVGRYVKQEDVIAEL